MDTAKKQSIINTIESTIGSSIDSSTIDLCEVAANRIAKSMECRKKTTMDSASLNYHSDQVSNAVRAISNKNGSTKASIPPMIILVIILALLAGLAKNDHIQRELQNLKQELNKVIK